MVDVRETYSGRKNGEGNTSSRSLERFLSVRVESVGELRQCVRQYS